MKYTKEQLLELKRLTDEINVIENNQIPLTPELLECLLVLVNQRIKSFPDKIDEILFESPTTSLCGCLGCRDGMPYCSCAMYQLCYTYRYDIALQLI
jgi:hypothetical protein